MTDLQGRETLTPSKGVNVFLPLEFSTKPDKSKNIYKSMGGAMTNVNTHKCDLTSTQQSLVQQRVPAIWKTSTILPVPENKLSKDICHFRPVALTSLVIIDFERLIKK